MYCTDTTSGETAFGFAAPRSAREVFLEFFRDGECHRVPMRRKSSRWIINLALAPGWFFYRFNVDGRPRWDRDAGRLNMDDGRCCSLAVISQGKAAL